MTTGPWNVRWVEGGPTAEETTRTANEALLALRNRPGRLGVILSSDEICAMFSDQIGR